MKRINELYDSEYIRCKSLYLASKNDLSVPYGFFISKEELQVMDYQKLFEKFNGRYFTAHAISHDIEINKIGAFFKKFELGAIKNFIQDISNKEIGGILFLSTGFESELDNAKKEDNLFFALKFEDGKLIIEGVHGFSNLLYHKGEKEYSFKISPNNLDTLPAQIKTFLDSHHKNIIKFNKEFGNSILEFGVVNGKNFFFEAKKDYINKIDTNEIEIISPINNKISGTVVDISGINKSDKNIFFAELPDISLTEYISFANAFIFNGGSRLCHLGIVLRENKIPALIVPGSSVLRNKKITIIPDKPFLILE